MLNKEQIAYIAKQWEVEENSPFYEELFGEEGEFTIWNELAGEDYIEELETVFDGDYYTTFNVVVQVGERFFMVETSRSYGDGEYKSKNIVSSCGVIEVKPVEITVTTYKPI